MKGRGTFLSKRAMAGICLGTGALAAVAFYGIYAMPDPKKATSKDVAATFSPAKVPSALMQRPADPAPTAPTSIAPQTETATPTAEKVEEQRPPSAPTPSIEEMARANAAAAAWTAYYAQKAELEKKRVEAIQAGLTSPMTVKPTLGTAAAAGPSVGALAASAQPSIGGGELTTGPQHRGAGGIWASADSKQAWADQTGTNGPDYVLGARHGTVSPYQVMAGTVLPAVTKGGMISDAPGRIVAQISQDVHCNTPAGGLCVPQGSTLILTYNNRVSQGECRLQVAAERLIFPDATSMDLGRLVVADVSGYSGVEDECQTHLGARLLNAVLFTTVQGAFTLGSAALGANAVNGQAVESVASQETRDGLRIPPTLLVRPGYAIGVMLPKDLVFSAPYTFDDGTQSAEDPN